MWTIQQQKAINKTDSDLLLTASAGSGKTAVLTERFLELIVNQQQPCNIDQILVVTFTRATVAEMHCRIGERLLKYVEEHPTDSHARRQLSMLNCARICTIDSYSSTLLKDYFYLADIDPAFEIIDPKEKSLVLTKILDEMLEEFYALSAGMESSEFLNFVKAYGGRGGDTQLPSIIRGLSSFIDTLVDADRWMCFCQPSTETMQDTIEYFQVSQISILKKHLNIVISQLECGEELLSIFSSVEHYREYISPTLEVLRYALTNIENDSGNSILKALEDRKSLLLNKALSRKSKGVDHGEKESITSVIKTAREAINKIPEELLTDHKTLARQIEAVTPHISAISELYKEYNIRYQKFKSANKVLDYSDLSHKVLDVLNDSGKPSIAAIEQQKMFEHILVDEYQDISPLQEALFAAIKRSTQDGGNMFMVGDLKQSIYRFRQADPGIILDKHNTYAPVFDADKEMQQSIGQSSRIELNKNFRSRREVVDFVNYIFDRCATSYFGGLDYITDGRMLFGANYYEDQQGNYLSKYDTPIEFHLIDSKCEIDNDIELQDSVRREVAVIAKRIKDIVTTAEFNVYCSKSSSMRPVTYSDIAILLRSPKSQAEIYSEIFSQYDIPLYVQQEGGFFNAMEIIDVMSILRLIDNPQQDVPMAAVLRGPYIGFTENELAEIRSEDTHSTFYAAVMAYANNGRNTYIKDRTANFLKILDGWRTLARAGTLASLIRKIYAQTGIVSHYRGLLDGRQRYANLLFLYDTAREYDTFSTQGLGRFLRFIDDLNAHASDDFGPAKILSENDNVVQLMSIHKSKGLEFPVVIVAGLGKKFNLRDLSKPIIYDQVENGAIAVKLRDFGTGQSWKTLPYAIMSERERLNCLYEELRVQYVALTRAREHLILFADTDIQRFKTYCSDLLSENKVSKLANKQKSESTALSESILSSAKTPLDWYGAALMEHPDFTSISGEVAEIPVNIPRFSLDIYDNIDQIITENTISAESGFDIEEIVKADTIIPDQNSTVSARMEWIYQSLPSTEYLARASVTTMNSSIDEDYHDGQVSSQRMVDDDFAYMNNAEFKRKPSFMLKSTERLSAAETGVITHRFLELVDVISDLDQKGLKVQLEKFVSTGYFTQHQADYINLDSISKLFRNDIGRLMVTNPIFREWEFTLAVPVSEVYADALTEVSDGEDKVIVRGIIDCLIWDGSSYTIIDFKTDDLRPDQLEGRAAHYEFQLDFYRRAVNEITGKPVSDCYLYFLKPAQVVKVI